MVPFAHDFSKTRAESGEGCNFAVGRACWLTTRTVSSSSMERSSTSQFIIIFNAALGAKHSTCRRAAVHERGESCYTFCTRRSLHSVQTCDLFSITKYVRLPCMLKKEMRTWSIRPTRLYVQWRQNLC